MGLPAILCIGLLIYASIVGIQDPHAVQGVVLLCVVALSSIGITAVFMYQRKRWLDTFFWYPTYGFMLQKEDWIAVTPAVFDAVVRMTIAKWAPFFSAESILKSDVNWVWMKKDLTENAMNPAHQKVHGLTIAGTHWVEVAYASPQTALEATAFAHELGHIIYGNATGNWDQVEHHKFMGAHGLL